MKNYKSVTIAMKKSDFLRSPWWIGVNFLFILSLLFTMKFAFAEISDSGSLKFDHSKTGFILSGSHIQARCASCHVNGVFKGTPRDCSSCHVAGNHMGAEAKTTKHIATVAQCDSCHQNTTWVPATFRHVGLPAGTCQTCHNGSSATGKPNGHIATTDSCDKCHKTIDWKQLTAGGALPANHLPTTQPCSTCHKQASLIPGTMSHVGIVSGCVNCHNGQSFTGVAPVKIPTTHLPTSMPCETCHSTSNFMSFAGTLMKHTGIVNGCANCHNGQAFVGVTPVTKGMGHMATMLDCSGCHTSTVSFAVGVNQTTLPVGHLPTTQACSTCHGTRGYGSGSGVMNHAGISSGCTSCHNGQTFAVGITPKSKPTNHLPTSASCETCHTTANTSSGGFAGGLMNHVGIVGGCTNCHNGQAFAGVTPVTKGGTHLPTTMSCETCHSSTNFALGTGFSGDPKLMMKHTGIVNNCTQCHNGQAFQGVTPVFKSTRHIPYAANLIGGAGMGCEFCHSKTIFTTFTTGLVSKTILHNGTTGNGAGWCIGCHLSGQSWSAPLQTKALNHDSPGKTDCSQSGCHRPTGNTGTSYINWS